MRACLTFLVALLPFALCAQPAPARPPESPPTVEEIQAIRKILELPPERLARVRSALEKIERMSPESRREFAGNLVRFESATPEGRKQLMKEMRERGGFGAHVLEIHFKTLSPADAKAERARLHGLTSEQRLEFVRGLTERYGPELAKERGKQGEPKDGGPKRRKPADGELTPAAR